ncbi:MAG: hypothetical protein CL908_14275 [Deltaproteobacteria bacterium]|nr:hypothetical protein [Deltaproteobacteria bacterium]
MRFAFLLFLVAEAATPAAALPGIAADETLTNPDSSKTFVRPRIVSQGGRLGIRQGIPGACHMFGMAGYLKEYVVWSNDLMDGVPLADDGRVGEVQRAKYVESMTCTSSQPYVPKITTQSKSENPDGSVTMGLPQIHHGPQEFPILSGHAGACQLLGYTHAVQHSREWSERRVLGVSLAADGQIYEVASGTSLTAFGCRNEP